MQWRPRAIALFRSLTRWPVLMALVVVGAIQVGSRVIRRRAFPADTTPDGAYARIALAIADRQPANAFAYLETDAQWAAYTLHDVRKQACDRVRASYPADEQARVLAPWTAECASTDGPDLFARLAVRRGWMARLERDLSGAAHVEVHGERATVVTGRGTRYAFRRRDNGIWGLTLFTAELQAEAERATRDLDIVSHAAADYDATRANR